MEKLPEQLNVSEKESKEKEKKPFFFVYRENDLFKRYVPFVQNFLKEQGYPVILQSFSAGTSEQEIKNWYLVHIIDLQAKNIFADNTSRRSCGFNREAGKYNLETKINLDKLMNSATTEAITGDAAFAQHLRDKWYEVYDNRDNPEKLRAAKEQYLSALGEIFKKILTSIPEERRKKLDFFILEGIFEGNENFESLIAHEPYYDKDNFEESSKETKKFVDQMRGWFKEIGISSVKTFTTGAEIPLEFVEKLMSGQAYIIFDRHTLSPDMDLDPGYRDDMEKFWGGNLTHSLQIREKSSLGMPIESFYIDVQKKIGAEADSQKMEESIKKIIQKEMAEEKQ